MYMADVLSAMLTLATAGAMATSRACCAELQEKQPKAQGTATAQTSAKLLAKGHSSKLAVMQPKASNTPVGAPNRSMLRDISKLPIKPKAPKTVKKIAIMPGVALNVLTKKGAW